MGIILFIIFIIFAIISFKVKDKRFPNNPILGWIVCMVVLAVGLYLLYNAWEGGRDIGAYNAGYRDAFK